ncbi:MAG: FtsQ-type POTRA domain-containing protein [bacterium]|nr:FtsQ-type POTRA domain-containing protein [bacterium]
MKKWFLAFLLSVTAAFFLFTGLPAYRRWLRTDSSFRIRRVVVEGNDLVPANDVLRRAEIRKGRNIWAVDRPAAEKRILRNPFIERVTVYRGFPDVVRVRVTERKPVVLLKTGGRFHTLDRNRVLMPAPPGRCYTLPILSVDEMPETAPGGTVEDPRVSEGLAFLESMLKDRPGLYGRISEIRPDPREGVVLTTSNGGIPVRIGRNGYEWKVRYLEAILNELETHPALTHASYIDLRFEGQVFVGFGA